MQAWKVQAKNVRGRMPGANSRRTPPRSAVLPSPSTSSSVNQERPPR